jgi:hypothetical protein
VAQRVPGGLGSQISWHSAREGGKVVSLTHRPPLPPGMFLVLGSESTPGPWYIRKEYVTEKSSDTIGSRSRDHPTSSTAPEQLRYPRPHYILYTIFIVRVNTATFFGCTYVDITYNNKIYFIVFKNTIQ